MSDTLARFHEVLIREIRNNRPEYLEEPFTVAEIYQNLVPYRTHRDALGLEMNGDYEHALLRLLGGEGEYLELESEVARRQIQDELGHPNPNTGLFRDFAAADVRLTGAHHSVSADTGPVSASDEGDGPRDLADLLKEAERALETDSFPAGDESVEDQPVDEAPVEEGLTGSAWAEEEPTGEEWTEEEPTGEDPEEPAEAESPTDPEAPRRLFVMAGGDGDAEDHDVSPEFDPEDPTVHAFGGQEDPEDRVERPEPTAGQGKPAEVEEDGEGDTCRWCRADLPPRNVLNFCPYCGSNLGMKPCGECGEELESSWMFCPKCGTEAEG